MSFRTYEDGKTRHMKQLITLGILAPSVARVLFPESAEVMTLSNFAAIIASLVWLWET